MKQNQNILCKELLCSSRHFGVSAALSMAPMQPVQQSSYMYPLSLVQLWGREARALSTPQAAAPDKTACRESGLHALLAQAELVLPVNHRRWRKFKTKSSRCSFASEGGDESMAHRAATRDPKALELLLIFILTG